MLYVVYIHICIQLDVDIASGLCMIELSYLR